MRLDDEIVQTQTFNQSQRLASTSFADSLHGHDRTHSENQPEQRESGSQLAARQLEKRLVPLSRAHQ